STRALFAEPAAMKADELICRHPAADALMRLFQVERQPVPKDFQPTQLTKADYLKIIAGEIDFWKQHENEAGAIIDPYEKKEHQYSTPAFALASAILVCDAKRSDLLDNSVRAMTFALTALANKTTADNHADLYIPM